MAFERRKLTKESIMQQKRTTPEFITELQPNEIFVFGSNLKGMHGGGAADMDKIEKYRLLTEQIRALIEGETDSVAVRANVCAAIHETMGFWWTGFYRVKNGELVLGPFQGPVACMHIGYGKGVCGTTWKEQQTIIVPDVEQFPGHIACSSLSRSEIVVPVFDIDGSVVAVLDIDSKDLSTFDNTDRQYLESICKMLTPLFN